MELTAKNYDFGQFHTLLLFLFPPFHICLTLFTALYHGKVLNLHSFLTKTTWVFWDLQIRRTAKWYPEKNIFNNWKVSLLHHLEAILVLNCWYNCCYILRFLLNYRGISPGIAYIIKCSTEMLNTNIPFFIGGYMEIKLQQDLKFRSYSSLLQPT